MRLTFCPYREIASLYAIEDEGLLVANVFVPEGGPPGIESFQLRTRLLEHGKQAGGLFQGLVVAGQSFEVSFRAQPGTHPQLTGSCRVGFVEVSVPAKVEP